MLLDCVEPQDAKFHYVPWIALWARAVIISPMVWLYFRFSLSFRYIDIEELMASQVIKIKGFPKDYNA